MYDKRRQDYARGLMNRDFDRARRQYNRKKYKMSFYENDLPEDMFFGSVMRKSRRRRMQSPKRRRRRPTPHPYAVRNNPSMYMDYPDLDTVYSDELNDIRRRFPGIEELPSRHRRAIRGRISRQQFSVPYNY